MAWNLTITNKGEYDDKQTESVFKGARNEPGSDFSDWKSSLTPEVTNAVAEALEARELIKLTVLKNCADDERELAQILSERTHSEVVQVIGKKIVLYKPAKDEKKRKIELPK